MKKKIHFLIVILIFTIFFQNFGMAKNSSIDESEIKQQIKTELRESVTEKEKQNSEIEFIKSPFSIVLDDNNKAIKIKINPEDNIKLIIKNMDSKGSPNSKIEIISFKEGKPISDENLSQEKIEREYSALQCDEITLISYGKFLVKSINLEVIAEMEFNVPDEKNSNEDAIDSNEANVETEVISASDKEAFEKATSTQNDKIDNVADENNKAEDNKILLVHDDTADEEHFVSQIEKEAQNSNVIENDKENKPLIAIDEITQKNEPSSNLIKEELSDVNENVNIANDKPKIKIDKDDENIKSAKPSFDSMDKVAQSDEQNNDIVKNRKKIKDDLILKDESLKEIKPQISLDKTDKGFENSDKEIKSVQNKIDFSNQNIKSADIASFSAPKIQKSGNIKTAAVVLPSSPTLLKPNLPENRSLQKIDDSVIDEPADIKSSKPEIDLKKSDEIKNSVITDKITHKLPESKNIDMKKPTVSSAETPIMKAPSSNEIAPVDENVKIDNKPVIKSKEENFAQIPNSSEVKMPEKISQKIQSSKPKIFEEENISSPVFPQTKQENIQKPIEEKAKKLAKGILKINVIKENSPIVGWIDIVDEKTDKIVANGDTFFSNPASFTLPAGKYTIVVTDKKVVPPIQEKIHSVEVLPNQTVLKTTTFVQGVVKVNVTKNLVPTSSAFVKIFDTKTHEKIIDDNTYKNNPVIAKLPFGNYYIEIEDYSIVPKQHRKIENVIVNGAQPVVKSVDFQEGSLLLHTRINDNPVGSRYDIYLAGDNKKIKSSNTKSNSGTAKLKLAAGDYNIKVYNNNCVIKSIKTFKNVHIQKESLTELDINFEEGKLKVLSTRGMSPLYTNVSIYKYNTNDRIYFDFTSRDTGEVAMRLPVGIYKVIVRDHNIKRKFPKVHISPNKTVKIHAKF